MNEGRENEWVNERENEWVNERMTEEARRIKSEWVRGTQYQRKRVGKRRTENERASEWVSESESHRNRESEWVSDGQRTSERASEWERQRGEAGSALLSFPCYLSSLPVLVRLTSFFRRLEFSYYCFVAVVFVFVLVLWSIVRGALCSPSIVSWCQFLSLFCSVLLRLHCQFDDDIIIWSLSDFCFVNFNFPV